MNDLKEICEIAKKMKDNVYIIDSEHIFSKKNDIIGLRITNMKNKKTLTRIDINFNSYKIESSDFVTEDKSNVTTINIDPIRTNIFIKEFLVKLKEAIKNNNLIPASEMFNSEEGDSIYEETKRVCQEMYSAMQYVKQIFAEKFNIKTDKEMMDYCINLVKNSDLKERYKKFKAGKYKDLEKEMSYKNNSDYNELDSQILEIINISVVNINWANGYIENVNRDFYPIINEIIENLVC